MDEFSVTTNVDNLPDGKTPEEFLRSVRGNINQYTDVSGVEFTEVAGSMNDDDLTGAVLSISLAGGGWIDEGSVVVSEVSSSHWTFTTVYTHFDGSHPVSGNREFGFRRSGDQVTFYTRGVDRMTAPIDAALNLNGFAFSQADQLWDSFQDEIVEAVGGQATTSTTVARPNWSQVEDVLSGQQPVSSIEGCSN